MDCRETGEPVPNVSEEAVSVIGSRAVMGMVGMPNENLKEGFDRRTCWLAFYE